MNSRKQRRLKRLERLYQRNLEDIDKIRYPKRNSEFEVQAEVYKDLSEMGYDVRGGVPARCQVGHNLPKVFLDLVIFKDQKPLVIIECKNDNSAGLYLNPGTRQDRRYSRFGVPVLKCSSIHAIEAVVLKVDEIVSGNMTGVYVAHSAVMLKGVKS